MGPNFLAIFVAALIPMIMGFIWYHPKVFGAAWMQAAGITDDKMKSANMGIIFGVSFVLSFILSFTMNAISYHDSFVLGSLYYETNGTMVPAEGSDAAKWLEHFRTHYSDACRTFKHGAFHGAILAGIGIVLPVLGTNALFERKGWKYIAVNAGYWIVTLSLMGGLIASWK